MRLTIVFITCAFLQVHASGWSQSVTISGKDLPLKKVFAAIQQQTGYFIFYDQKILKGSHPVSLDIHDIPVQDLLNKILQDQPISFDIKNKVIVLSKKVEQIKNDSSAAKQFPYNIRPPVYGQVLNTEGQPLDGASVRIKGTSQGTVTDAQGRFHLETTPGQTLVISYTGYTAQEIYIDKQTEFHILLQAAVNELDNLVVIAYGQTSKRVSTGNITKVSAEQIERQPVTNVLGALSANVPGLSITQSTGLPGSGYNVLIRGRNSISSGNDPLYVIDGVPFSSNSLVSSTTSGTVLPFSSPLSSINPQDIESISVLKDADATAIYGSRGANGVILITTKKGKAGTTRVDIQGSVGTGKITRSMDFLDTKQYLEMRHEAFANDHADPQPYDYDVNGVFDTTRYTDWKKTLIGGHASIANIGATISGGSQQTQYLLGGNFSSETPPVFGNFKDSKGSVHLQASHSSMDGRFQSSVSVIYADESNQLQSYDPTALIANLPPDAPAIYDSTGGLNWLGGTFSNPFSALKQSYHIHTTNLVATSSLSYKFKNNIQLKIDGGYNRLQADEQELFSLSSFNPAYGLTSGSSTFAHHYVTTWNIEPQISYHHRLLKGQLQLLGGITFQSTQDQAQTISAGGFPSDDLLKNLQAATNIYVLQNDGYLYRYNAFFGRFTYNWQDKYLLNMSGRRDGSSRFGPGKRFSDFGAVGAGWVFSKESFAASWSPLISFGKLRASYGVTGNDKIGDYAYLDTYKPTSRPYAGNPGLYPVRLFNADYSWEKNKKFEVGLELGLLHDKIWYSINYYRNRSSNQLVGYSLSAVTGFNSIQFNLPATVQNSGWEMELTSQNINTNHFNWKTSFNITLPANKLISFPGLSGSSYANTYLVGESFDARRLFQSAGVDPNTGAYQFISSDHGTPTLTPSYPNELITSRKKGRTLYGGLENNFHYQNWELDILFQFVKQTASNYIGTAANAPGFYGNQPTLVLDRWQKQGDQKPVQRFTQDYASNAYNSFINAEYYGDNAISDASFIRLKNIALSYTLPASVQTKLHLQDTRIFMQAQNVLTITSFPGMDPETQYNLYLPPLQLWTLGIKLTL